MPGNNALVREDMWKIAKFKRSMPNSIFHCQISLNNAKNMPIWQSIILLSNAFKNAKIMPNSEICERVRQSGRVRKLFASLRTDADATLRVAADADADDRKRTRPSKGHQLRVS